MAQEALRVPDSARRLDPKASPSRIGQQAAAGLGGGEPLPDAVRADFESRFGFDFSRVRVHGDSQSARSADELGASAYTTGRSIVFGRGQFDPATAKGRDLLAHELAHVVQQERGDVAPSIQRRLIVTAADKKDADSMLRLLEGPSGLSLKRDPKTGEVTATVKNAKPPSPSLAAELLGIINDKSQDAEIEAVHADPKGMNISFGAFPDDPKHPVQTVRMDQLLTMEKGVPGGGAFKLAHEISENYETHNPAIIAPYKLPPDKQPKDLKPWYMVHEEDVHKLAEARANPVASELIGPGERQAMFKVVMGKAPKEILRTVEDMAQYFLTWDEPFGRAGAMFNAQKKARKRVLTRTISGFDPGSIDFDKVGLVDIADLATAMKNNPTATAVVEAFASGGKTPGDDEKLARRRALLVESLMIDSAGNTNIVFSGRFAEKGGSDKSRNSVVVTIDRPAD